MINIPERGKIACILVRTKAAATYSFVFCVWAFALTACKSTFATSKEAALRKVWGILTSINDVCSGKMKVIPKTLVDRADLKHINDLNLWWFAFLDDDWQTLKCWRQNTLFLMTYCSFSSCYAVTFFLMRDIVSPIVLHIYQFLRGIPSPAPVHA